MIAIAQQEGRQAGTHLVRKPVIVMGNLPRLAAGAIAAESAWGKYGLPASITEIDVRE